MIIETFPVGLLQCNCTIIASEQTGEAIVIDPGDEVARVVERLDRRRLQVRYIVATHGHIDHVGGFKELKEATGAPVLLHNADMFLYEALPMQASLLRIETPPATEIDDRLKHGDELGAGDVKLKVIHTPGHTPGSICFHSTVGEARLFAGDTLFLGSIGRTDLWRGSYEEILESLRRRVVTLPDDTVVVPGHGPQTTIGREKRENPFLQF